MQMKKTNAPVRRGNRRALSAIVAAAATAAGIGLGHAAHADSLSLAPAVFSPSPAPAAGSSNDLTLVVNDVYGGDVFLQANTTMGLTLYNIVDPSKTLIKTAALLISKTNTNWQVIKNTASILAEGQNSQTYNAAESTTFDTIHLTAGQTIDLGDVFNLTSGVRDLTLEFSEPNTQTGDPTTGTTYNGTQVCYESGGSCMPEPAGLGLLGLAGLAMIRRGRRRSANTK
jgi:MYXO-CTERM domain-containing protein